MEEEPVSFSAVFFAKEARVSYRREEGRAGRCKNGNLIDAKLPRRRGPS